MFPFSLIQVNLLSPISCLSDNMNINPAPLTPSYSKYKHIDFKFNYFLFFFTPLINTLISTTNDKQLSYEQHQLKSLDVAYIFFIPYFFSMYNNYCILCTFFIYLIISIFSHFLFIMGILANLYIFLSYL